MSDTPETDAACETPIEELIRKVPTDLRIEVQEGQYGVHLIPVGVHCAKAADTLSELRRRLTSMTQERDKARAMVSVAQAFVDRIESIHNDQHYQSVWIEYANHGGDYTHGPKYDKELAALKDALAALAALDQIGKEANE